MDSALDFHTARALLEWQVELGATEALLDAPLDRYEAPIKAAQSKSKSTPPPVMQAAPTSKVDPVVVAEKLASAAQDLDALRAAMAGFEHCELKRGARNLVFSNGNPAARVMIIGEAPGRDEDREGKPIIGRAGQLLDRMFAAIDMARDHHLSAQSVYITNVLPWRLPQNRGPQPEEIAMLMPFLRRHIEIVAPEVIVLMGNISCQAMLKKRGITRLRGTWTEALGKPVLPMLHPADLLRQPHAKREAWADLLSLKSKLKAL